MRRAKLTRRRAFAVSGVLLASMAGCAGPTGPSGSATRQLQPNQPQQLSRISAETVAFSPNQSVIASDASEDRRPSPAEAGNCKTVKLFDRVKPKMHRKAPKHLKPWLGHWGPGLWGGKLCHELVIEEIRADGSVRVADLQGFYLPWDRWPTAFRREARFLEDGRLEVKQGRMGVSIYTLQDGALHGAYSWGASPLHVTLAKKR